MTPNQFALHYLPQYKHCSLLVCDKICPKVLATFLHCMPLLYCFFYQASIGCAITCKFEKLHATVLHSVVLKSTSLLNIPYKGGLTSRLFLATMLSTFENVAIICWLLLNFGPKFISSWSHKRSMGEPSSSRLAF